MYTTLNITLIYFQILTLLFQQNLKVAFKIRVERFKADGMRVAGLALVAVGIYCKYNLKEYVQVVSHDNLGITCALVIVMGVVLLVIALFGCVATFLEKPGLLTLYIILMLAFLILQIPLGAYAFLQCQKTQEIKNGFQYEFLEIFQQFETNMSTDYRAFIDSVQQGFQCCGVDGPKDWEDWNYGEILESCCIDESGECKELNAYQVGCFDTVWTFLQDSVQRIGYVVLPSLVLELVGIIVALLLLKTMRTNEEQMALLTGE